jgi:hypothetical protein
MVIRSSGGQCSGGSAVSGIRKPSWPPGGQPWRSTLPVRTLPVEHVASPPQLGRYLLGHVPLLLLCNVGVREEVRALRLIRHHHVEFLRNTKGQFLSERRDEGQIVAILELGELHKAWFALLLFGPHHHEAVLHLPPHRLRPLRVQARVVVGVRGLVSSWRSARLIVKAIRPGVAELVRLGPIILCCFVPAYALL